MTDKPTVKTHVEDLMDPSFVRRIYRGHASCMRCDNSGRSSAAATSIPTPFVTVCGSRRWSGLREPMKRYVRIIVYIDGANNPCISLCGSTGSTDCSAIRLCYVAGHAAPGGALIRGTRLSAFIRAPNAQCTGNAVPPAPAPGRATDTEHLFRIEWHRLLIEWILGEACTPRRSWGTESATMPQHSPTTRCSHRGTGTRNSGA